MSKLKSFFIGLCLITIFFVMVVLAAIMYRAYDRTSIRSYIFQLNNSAKQRVGELEDINDMSAEDLRNKLIKLYISEYFKVIPGDTDIANRPIILNTSFEDAYNYWHENELPNIESMSSQKKFRKAYVYENGISALNKPKNYDYNKNIVQPIYYSVRYYTITWSEPNKMDTKPIIEQGVINIEVAFTTGIRDNINIQKHLQQGKSPIGLFKFLVTNIENKGK